MRSLTEYLEKNNIYYNDVILRMFEDYRSGVLEKNRFINLTAITDPEEFTLKHFVDSMTISKRIKKDAKVIDVGTGAGFPGIPLKIIREDIEVTLLDSLNKRINFLEEVIQQLGLTKIRAIHSRVEELGKNKKYRENFDCSVSRAVANLSTLSEYLIPLVMINGCCISMKGPSVEEEIQQSQNAISILGGKIEEVEKFQLPKSDIDRNVVVIRKIKPTPPKYPRKPGMTAKEPIK